MGNVKPRNRFVWIVVIFLAVIGLASAVRRILLIEHIIPAFDPPNNRGFDSGFAKHPTLTLIHIIPGGLFMILGPIQFIKRTVNLRKWTTVLFFISAYIIGISALVMSYAVSIGGANETAATTLFGLFFLFSLTKALLHGFKHRWALYRDWMLRAFAIGLAIATIRPIIGLFFALSSLSPHEFFGIAFWLGFTIHLIAVEAWIRRRRPGYARNIDQPAEVI